MMDKNDIRSLTKDDLVTKVTYKGKRVGTMDHHLSLAKASKMDITYEKMAEITGVSEYEVRRYLGLLQ